MNAPDPHAQLAAPEKFAELLAQRDAWEVVTFEDERQAPTGFAQPARAW